MVDDEVELVEVLELELVLVARWVVVVLARWVVVVSGGSVVVGAGAVVVDDDVDDEEEDEEEEDVESVVSVTPKEVADAPGDDRPNMNTPTIRATTPAHNAASEARRGVGVRFTTATLDRRVLVTGSRSAHSEHQ